MGREERDPQDARTTRSTRRTTQPTDRLDDEGPVYGEPVNPDWRGSRSTRRGRRSQGLPSSRQEFVLWLQYGGWRVLLAAAALVAVLIALIYITRMPSSASSPFGKPTESAAAGQAPLLPVQPTVTPRAITPTLEIARNGTAASGGGAQFRVFNTGTEGLFLRPDHSSEGTPLKTLPEGTIVTVIGEDFSAPNRVWKHVRDPEGTEGWAAADFLQAVQ
ncbi:MAG TPA: SH3 domain-containing protein [Roseiflexaceae bacterium]|nr:SH3 domain-containing protein [Roseiflexaceae bacterium]